MNLTTRRAYVATGDRAHDVLFAPDGRLVLSQTGRLLDGRPLGREAHHLAFTPAEGQVWVSDNAWRGRGFVVDPEGLRLLARLRFPAAPHHVAITPDGRFAAIANHSGRSGVVYRVRTRRVLAPIDRGLGLHGVWAAPRSP